MTDMVQGLTRTKLFVKTKVGETSWASTSTILKVRHFYELEYNWLNSVSYRLEGWGFPIFLGGSPKKLLADGISNHTNLSLT